MKKFLASLLILVILATVPVCAADSILPEAETIKAKYVSSTWLNFPAEYAVWMVILTPYQDRADVDYDISSIIKRQIEEGLTQAHDNIDEILASVNTEKINYKLKSLFDVTLTDATVKLLDVSSGTQLKLCVDVGLKESDPKPLILHSLESKAGAWEALDDSQVQVHKDNTITLYLDSFCPVMVLLPEEVVSAPVEKEDPIEPEITIPENLPKEKQSIPAALIVINAVSIIGLAFAAYILTAIENKKTNSRFFFAIQSIKLNIEIFIAKNRAR